MVVPEQNFKDKAEDFGDFDFAEDIQNHDQKEKELNRKIFLLKIKQFFLKFHHFPTLLLEFFKKSFFGLLKLWGIILVIIILGFLYITDSYKTLYFKVNISLERSRLENLQEILDKTKKEISESQKNMSCYKNQFKRIANNQEVKIDFCGK